MTEDNKDFLAEIIAERTASNPRFPQMVEAALRKRQLMRQLTQEREKLGLSQTEIAARMKTSQAALARLERGEIDPRFSTVARYAEAVGKKLEWHLS